MLFRWTVVTIVLLIISCSSCLGQINDLSPGEACAPSKTKTELAEAVLQPFWMSKRMDRESMLFRTTEASSTPSATLLYRPSEIISVTSADERITYSAGTDYAWLPGTDKLILLSGSSIPFRTWSELHPPIDSANSIGTSRDGKSGIFFERFGGMFQSLQVSVTYKHRVVRTDDPSIIRTASLRSLAERLKRKSRIKLVVLGDSISVGFGASQNFHSPPCEPPYPELIANALRVKYKVHVDLRNLSVGGKTAQWGAEMAHLVAVERPDLVIVAFGMNDASAGRSAVAFGQNVREILRGIQASSPQAQFLLIATMYGNPEWSKANSNLYEQYRAALLDIAHDEVAVVDMTQMSRNILKVKPFTDITANGVNHPNDFMHRVYAELVLQYLR